MAELRRGPAEFSLCHGSAPVACICMEVKYCVLAYGAGAVEREEVRNDQTTLPSGNLGYARCMGWGKEQGDTNRWIQISKARIRFGGLDVHNGNDLMDLF